jgi:hypothetical protein
MSPTPLLFFTDELAGVGGDRVKDKTIPFGEPLREDSHGSEVRSLSFNNRFQRRVDVPEDRAGTEGFLEFIEHLSVGRGPSEGVILPEEVIEVLDEDDDDG